jgi:hypothetical protein
MSHSRRFPLRRLRLLPLLAVLWGAGCPSDPYVPECPQWLNIVVVVEPADAQAAPGSTVEFNMTMDTPSGSSFEGWRALPPGGGEPGLPPGTQAQQSVDGSNAGTLVSRLTVVVTEALDGYRFQYSARPSTPEIPEGCPAPSFTSTREALLTVTSTPRFEVTLDPPTVELSDDADIGRVSGDFLVDLVLTAQLLGLDSLDADRVVRVYASDQVELPGRLAFGSAGGLTQGGATASSACDLPVLATIGNASGSGDAPLELTFLPGAGPLAPAGRYVIPLITREVGEDFSGCGSLFRTEPALTIDVVEADNVITWTGNAGTSDWRTGANWDRVLAPDTGDVVVIPSGAQVVLDGDGPNVRIDRLLLAGELNLEGGARLEVVHDIDGPSGTLRVLEGLPGFVFTGVSLGANSSLSVLELASALEQLGYYPEQSFDDKPVLEVDSTLIRAVAGVGSPATVGIQLRLSRIATIDGTQGGFSPGSLSTVEILPGAQLTVTGGLNTVIGTGGSSIGAARIINRGDIRLQVQGVTVNSRLENHGTITLDQSAAFTARGENHGTIRSLALLGLGTLSLQGRSGDAPYWTFSSSSIVEENLRTVSIAGSSVVDGRLRANRLTLQDAPNNQAATHILDWTEIDVDTVTASASVVEAQFSGSVGVDLLVIADTLRLPDFGAVGSNVFSTRQLQLQFGSVLEGEVLEAQDVLLGPGAPAAPITLDGRLWITGTASATHVTVVGRTGWLELRPGAILDLNPGTTNAVELRPERPGIGVDLLFVNNGTILKRGLGSASITACFGQSGPGTVTNDAGATPIVITDLTC